jgi:ATP-binding cassette subfamily B protein
MKDFINEIGMPLRLIHNFLPPKKTFQFFLLFLLITAGGILEAVSLGSVVPFLVAMAEPLKILNATEGLRDSLDLNKNLIHAENIKIVFGVLFICISLAAGGMRILTIWAGLRYSSTAGNNLSSLLFGKVLNQPLSFHLRTNSSTSIDMLTEKIRLAVVNINCLVNLLSGLALVALISVTLLLLSPLSFLFSMTVLGVVYGTILFCTQKKVIENGKLISRESVRSIKILQESLGGVRDILLEKLQVQFCRTFDDSDSSARNCRTTNTFISFLPRVITESLFLTFFACIAIFLSFKSKSLVEALPTLGLLALGAQRLLPGLQAVYQNWSTIVGNNPSVALLYKWLEIPSQGVLPKPAVKKMRFRAKIRFESVCFKYNEKSDPVLQNISFEINKGAICALVGKTGSGKSTCLDLLMGLITPSSGKIFIDNKILSPCTTDSWQALISHVPQAVYLADTSFAENIAFGIARQNIDMHKVREAAHQSQLGGYIESLEKGYETAIGERGTRLSGGQRQRIGIARALYKKSKVLLMDEATNALDQKTEKKIIETIKGLDKNLTTIFISHRQSSLRYCDQVIKIEKHNEKTPRSC